MKSFFVLVLQFFLIYTVIKWFREQFVFKQHEYMYIWILHYVSTFEPNFNFMTDRGLAYILLAIGYVGISAINPSLMIFTE